MRLLHFQLNMVLEITFGIAIVLILIVGLMNRRKQNKAWLEQERREESGAWIDKRSGERGAFGSLDAEREAERFSLTRQGRVNDLALEIRNYAFEHIPGFSDLSDDQIRAFTVVAREQSGKIFIAAESVQRGQLPEFKGPYEASGDRVQALKTIILNRLYEQFPALLSQELDLIRQLDAYTAFAAKSLVEKTESFLLH